LQVRRKFRTRNGRYPVAVWVSLTVESQYLKVALKFTALVDIDRITSFEFTAATCVTDPHVCGLVKDFKFNIVFCGT
jgi:hypothetical protein